LPGATAQEFHLMKHRLLISLFAVAGSPLWLAGCDRDAEESRSAGTAPVAEEAGNSEPAAPTVDQRLAAFLDEVFERNVSESPEFQAQLGRKTADYGRWDDHSEDRAIRRHEQIQSDLARLRAEFDVEALGPESRVSYRIFEYDSESALRDFPWRQHRYAVSQMDNIASRVPSFLQNLHRVDSLQDAEAYVSRLAGAETVMDQYVERLRLGEARGVVPPMMVYPRVLPAARNMLTGAPFDETAPDGVLMADFRAKVDALDLDPDARSRLMEDAAEALRGPFRAGYERLIGELVRLQGIADDNNGVWDLPDGEAYYASRARSSTTLDMPVAEIHEVGLVEVARIRSEMEAIMATVDFDGDLQAFFDYVRNDPDNYYPNTDAGREAYVREATALIEGVYAIADDYFNVLPKAPLEVRRVEPWRENGSSTAFYQRPAPDGSRPGIYYINQQNMNAVQKHIMNSLAYHEGAPGHHFQLAIQQELEGIPEFRKYLGYTAYVEGWALYSERLAFEAGMYEGLPLRDFGRLAEEMKRAVRLVVDTGMHAKRWTREECIAYMTANTPMAPADIERQIERYFVIPGQALAYKTGMIKILELRARAADALGDDFDIREFHDLVLKNGAMPMGILETVIDEHIESRGG
jgi:uncharacterized protein (DUF885 family)